MTTYLVSGLDGCKIQEHIKPPYMSGRSTSFSHTMLIQFNIQFINNLFINKIATISNPQQGSLYLHGAQNMLKAFITRFYLHNESKEGGTRSLCPLVKIKYCSVPSSRTNL